MVTDGTTELTSEAERLANAAVSGRNSAAIVLGCSADSTGAVFGGEASKVHAHNSCPTVHVVSLDAFRSHLSSGHLTTLTVIYERTGMLSTTLRQLLTTDLVETNPLSDEQLQQTGVRLTHADNAVYTAQH